MFLYFDMIYLLLFNTAFILSLFILGFSFYLNMSFIYFYEILSPLKSLLISFVTSLLVFDSNYWGLCCGIRLETFESMMFYLDFYI